MQRAVAGPGCPPFKLLVIADPRSATSTALVGAALRSAADRDDVQVVAVVDAAQRSAGRMRFPRTAAARLVRRAFEPRGPSVELERRPLLTTCATHARRHRVPVLVPPGRRVNNAAFVEHIRSDLKPDAALALMVAQVFEAPLLAACATPANYHNGLLPQYRGIAATAWSLYRAAPRSGFAYHHMNEAVDAGPLLLEDTVPVPPGAVTADVEQAKTTLAAERMPEALGLLLERAAGRAQGGEPCTFTRADLKAIREVGDPSLQTWAELERRLRSFELIHLELARKRWEVTALRRVARDPRRAELAFTTADGVRAEPTRFVHLPLSVYRAYRPLRGGAA